MFLNIFWLLIALYLISAAFFIILENRRPQSTYAWLLVFVALPIIGLLIYIFLGRSSKTFSQETRMTRDVIDGDFKKTLQSQIMSTPEIVERMSKENPEDVDLKLMELVSHNVGTHLTGRNEVKILQDANNFYPALLEDLRQAKHHIHLQYYIWTNDDFTQELKEVLIERARAGVIVRALYDASSKSMLSDDYIADLQDNGIAFIPYLGYNTLRTIHLANYRCHRKIAIIDGRIGYVGGMNLDREQMPGVAWPRWRDTQVRIHGEAAQALQVAFFTAWNNTKAEQIDDKLAYFPDLSEEVPDLLPVQITMSGPDSQWHGIRQLYFHLIVSARDHVYIQSPFFIPDETISEAMKSAALGGVDVRMICTPRGATFQIPYRAANTYFQEMAEAGVKIYLYNGGYYHAKTVNMDSQICSIGSCNMDIRSYNLNYEINSVLFDRDQAQELTDQFMADLEDCTEFDLEEYNSRSTWSRFVDSLYRLASPSM
jgi:cardiolipin synthase